MGLFSRKKDESPSGHRPPRARAQPSRSGDPRCRAPSAAAAGTWITSIRYREVMFMHCTQCYAKYEVARADMAPDVTAEASTI